MPCQKCQSTEYFLTLRLKQKFVETFLVGTEPNFICSICLFEEGNRVNINALIEGFNKFVLSVNEVVQEVEKNNPELKGLDKEKIARDSLLAIYTQIKEDLNIMNPMLDFAVMNLVIPFLISNAVDKFNLSGVFTHSN